MRKRRLLWRFFFAYFWITLVAMVGVVLYASQKVQRAVRGRGRLATGDRRPHVRCPAERSAGRRRRRARSGHLRRAGPHARCPRDRDPALGPGGGRQRRRPPADGEPRRAGGGGRGAGGLDRPLDPLQHDAEGRPALRGPAHCPRRPRGGGRADGHAAAAADPGPGRRLLANRRGGPAVAALLALVSFLASRRIVRPLEEIRRGAERFARGELNHRLLGF